MRWSGVSHHFCHVALAHGSWGCTLLSACDMPPECSAMLKEACAVGLVGLNCRFASVNA